MACLKCCERVLVLMVPDCASAHPSSHTLRVPPSDFDTISTDPEVVAKLRDAYPSVHSIDAWVGGLAEDHVYVPFACLPRPSRPAAHHLLCMASPNQPWACSGPSMHSDVVGKGNSGVALSRTACCRHLARVSHDHVSELGRP